MHANIARAAGAVALAATVAMTAACGTGSHGGTVTARSILAGDGYTPAANAGSLAAVRSSFGVDAPYVTGMADGTNLTCGEEVAVVADAAGVDSMGGPDLLVSYMQGAVPRSSVTWARRGGSYVVRVDASTRQFTSAPVPGPN